MANENRSMANSATKHEAELFFPAKTLNYLRQSILLPSMARKNLKIKGNAAAKERIAYLFEQADRVFEEHPDYSQKYVDLARKIAMKNKVRIPSGLQKRFCKHCYAFFRPSVTCRARLQGGKLVYYCFKCKNYSRYPYK
ncbi:MAG: ribonuclease P protein component 4 [Candidatus Woesearchaeota archaeon]